MILERLRPQPHRGPVTAAGAVPLALAVLVIELRMTQWSLGARFAVVALAAALLLAIGGLASLEHELPRAFHSVLLIAGLLLLALALVLLAEVLGARRAPGPGAIAWTFAVEGAVSAAVARRASSAACTLIAAIAATVALEAFVVWAFKPHGLGTYRALLLVVTLVYTGGAIRLRDRRRRHAVQLINAAGLAALALAATFVTVLGGLIQFAAGQTSFHLSRGLGGAAFGWQLYLVAVGFGLLGYAAADREPGPAYIGTAVLFGFAFSSGLSTVHRGSLVGWPLFLLLVGATGLVLGLRPVRPLPPEPPASGTRRPSTTTPQAPVSPPTVPLRPLDDEQ